MKELLANTVQSIKHYIYVDGEPTTPSTPVEIKIFKNDVELISSEATEIEDGKYSYVIPSSATVNSQVYDILGSEGEISITWEFTISGSAFNISEPYRIVVPYADWSDFEPLAVANNYSYQDFLESERVARYLIHFFCGQTFGKEEATYSVEGNGMDSLALPRRMITLDTISYFVDETRPGSIIGYPAESVWELSADNWMLRSQPQTIGLNIVNDINPKFSRNKRYHIKALWGYDSVPSEVKEAAKILTADFLCAEHKYRDRYLQSIKMNDWRLEFNKMAFQGTGNAVVDSILRDFRINSIGLI